MGAIHREVRSLKTLLQRLPFPWQRSHRGEQHGGARRGLDAVFLRDGMGRIALGHFVLGPFALAWLICLCAQPSHLPQGAKPC